MSERHLLRRFTAELGVTPARYVATARVEAARRELEETDASVATIAVRAGFGTAESMRRTFVRRPRHATRRLPPPLRQTPITPPKEVLMTSIAIPLFPRFTALDGIGPYEVLQRIPGFDITFVGHRRGVVRSENGFLGIEVDATFDELAGAGRRRVSRRRRHPRPAPRRGGARLGAPRPRDDDVHDVGVHRVARARRRRAARRAHRDDALGAMDVLAKYGATPVGERVVEHLDRRIITAAGVSSGIDMALRLVEVLVDRTAAEAAQLMIEYDPQPPFDAGSVDKAGDDVMTRVIEYAARPPVTAAAP